jgi:hypothetical protein
LFLARRYFANNRNKGLLDFQQRLREFHRFHQGRSSPLDILDP